MMKREKLLTFYIKSFFEAFAVAPIMTGIYYFVAVLEGLAYGFIAKVLENFFSSVSDYLGKTGTFSAIITSTLLLMALLIFCRITNAVFNISMVGLKEKMSGFFTEKVNLKVQQLEPIMFENSKTFEDINKATQGAQATFDSVDAVVFAVCNFLPYYLVMFFYLFSLDSILSVVLLLVFAPMLLSHWLKSRWYGKLEDLVAPTRREYSFYSSYMSNKETRVLGAFEFFREKTKAVIGILNKEIWNNQKRVAIFEAFMSTITLLGYGGILFLFTRSLLKGNISAAAFAAIFGSIDSMFAFLSILLTRNISIVSQNLGLVKNYYRFCNLDIQQGTQVETDLDAGIKLKGVSFTYPNQDSKALENINLEIKNGETVAFVGENGSGKSTLVKLIAGVYHPTDGKLKIFGAERFKENVQQRFDGVSAVFQDFQQYKMTLKTNVQISDLDFLETDRELKALAETAGIDINSRSLTNGYETILSREFDGVDLSIGQWQRVAIARGLHRKSNLIFLDEPTASIDPIEESELFRQFMNMSKGHTTIIVTHRLGSVKFADKICVLDKGHIVEVGTHSDLMERNGVYKELYQTQAKWYIN